MPVVVHIGAPIKAPRAGTAFTATIQVRDAARRFILEYCGESDLTDMPAEDAGSNATSIERLQLDPSSMFESPAALLECEKFSNAQKIDLLRRWYLDAVEIAVAEEEGMPCRDGDLAREILLSLQQLAPIDVDHVGPAKQHGLAARERPSCSPSGRSDTAASHGRQLR